MRKFILTIVAAFACTLSYGQDSQIKLKDFKEIKSANGLPNLMALFNQDKWPKDMDGRNYCALIRVSFENMGNDDARKVAFYFGNTSPVVKEEDHLDDHVSERWIFVTPSNKTYMEVSIEKFGKSNRLSDIQLVEKGVYDVVVHNDKTISINVITLPKGLTATLENGQHDITDATFANVPYGKHTLTLSKNGTILKTDVIEVSENNVKFEYDLREKKTIKFESDPTGATLFINGEKKGRTPVEISLPYDSYNIKAVLGPGEEDEQSITVNALSPMTLKLEPIKKKTFDVYAIYNGSKVNADLYIDGKSEGQNKPSYTLTLPIGKTYNMNMLYHGNGKKRKIKVTPYMPVEQCFKISARNSFVWPWQREYDAAPVGFGLSYVYKQLVTKGEGEKLKENGIWEDGQDEYLHGVQVGLHFQPCFSFGLGLYTGLFYEFYYSSNDKYDYNKFMEHCLYMPIHAYYRIPFSKKVALSIHGGFGFSYSIYGAFSAKESYYDDITDFYGEDGFPKRLNITADIAAGLRLGPVQINVQYSKGINDHKSYVAVGDYKTTQNKYVIGLSYMFSAN